MPAPDRHARDHGPDEEWSGDLIDRVPIVGRATTQLERSIGPSCLLSAIMVFLILVAFRRLLQLPIPMLFLLVGIVWFLILMLLVRWRPNLTVDEDD